MNITRLKEKLERNGYWLDELGSMPNSIRVCQIECGCGVPMYFTSLKELKYWIKEVSEYE